MTYLLNTLHRCRTSLCMLLLVFLTGCFPLFVAGTATGASILVDRRTAGTVVDDQALELKALHELAKQPFWPNSHVSITSFNGNILLSGQVPSLESKNRITELLLPFPRVRKIYNELTVDKPSNIKTRAYDTWVTGKIKAKLLATKDVTPMHIKVVTENGTVYLLGLVSHDEAILATRATQQVSGVRKIMRLFEYIQPPKAAAGQQLQT